jgi:phage/plasmid-like protein (TIGR03299 family)
MSETTITRPDVNAAFAAERLAMVGRIESLKTDEGRAAYVAEQTARFEQRVQAGELVSLGDGRYQSTQGWDAGEVWTVRDVDGTALVLPEHGLDMAEDGKTARLYLGGEQPAWHSLGQWIPGGITDVEEVIKLGRLDVPVYSVPAADFKVPGIAGKISPAGQFHVGNGSTGEYWGTVGKVHKNVPIRTSFAFLQHLVDDGKVTWESAGLMGNGRRVFISVRLPESIIIDPDGVADRTELFAVVQDARDGSSSYKVMLTPWRVLCRNTNRFALRDAVAVAPLRHTTGLPGRIEQARQTLGMSVKYAGEFAAEGTALLRAKTSTEQAEALLAEFFTVEAGGVGVFGGRDKAAEGKRTALSNDRREDDLTERLGTEFARVGRNLYAVEQAATGHLDWGKVRTGTDELDRWHARIEASLAGADDRVKSTVHARLLTLVSA